MRSRKIGFMVGVSLAAALLLTIGAQAQTAALSGTVSSAKEGAMEGVLVTVKKEGSTIATTVVTDDKGQYNFPADRLEPGKYAVTIRAVGYVLDGPKSVEISGRQGRQGRHQAQHSAERPDAAHQRANG